VRGKKIAGKTPGRATEQASAKTGRPLCEVDPGMVEKLAQVNCPNTEIASFVGCSVDTLTRRFADVLAKGRENSKTRLRQAQFKSALGGNVVMQIWLGKQMLGQADKIEQKTEVSGEIRSPGFSEADSKAVKDWVKEIQAEVRGPSNPAK
jgi:hypothetical protein